MTSATERLRALLDERGVEWRPIAWNPKKETFYYTSDGVCFCADEYVDGVKIYTDAIITPEQAVDATLGETPTPHVEDLGRLHDELRDAIVEILGNRCDWDQAGVRHAHEVLERAATLGPGTCKVEESWHGESEMVEYRCTACDEYMVVEVVKPDGAQQPNYCPNCGKRVVE